MPEVPVDQSPSDETPSRNRMWQRTAGAAAVVAVLVVGNSTAANAAPPAGTSAASDLTSSDPSSRVTPTPAALHGEFRVVNRDGSAQLRRWQSGEVDAIDAISLTVRSADGFDSTYLLGPGVSVTGIGLGDEVTVVGAGQSRSDRV